MAEQTRQSYLSIGEVLGLLLEEFPDVTISKIRFLESQGLIDPERTPAGYRKFYEADIELLRVILREQKQNFLPLRVIKDRLDSGQIDPSGEIASPVASATESSEPVAADPAPVGPEQLDLSQAAGERDTDAVAGDTVGDPVGGDSPGDAEPAPPTRSRGAARRESGALVSLEDLCERTSLSAVQVDELTTFGLVHPIMRSGVALFDDSCVQIAELCGQLMRSGVEPRHLKGWRTAAERETSLYEQLIAPRLRQRSPAAHAEAIAELHGLVHIGEQLHQALIAGIVRRQFDG